MMMGPLDQLTAALLWPGQRAVMMKTVAAEATAGLRHDGQSDGLQVGAPARARRLDPGGGPCAAAPLLSARQHAIVQKCQALGAAPF